MNAFERAVVDHRAALEASVDALTGPFEEVAAMLAERVLAGRRLLVCGNGGSAADAQHFASELVGRFEAERRAVPAQVLHGDPSALTAISNDYGYQHVFARQVEAFGTAGDVLVVLSTSGRSPNIVNAATTGRELGLTVVALTGRDGGDVAPISDHVLAVPADVVARIQEVHGLLLHSLADAIEDAVARDDGATDA